jgi:hypothetical protein
MCERAARSLTESGSFVTHTGRPATTCGAGRPAAACVSAGTMCCSRVREPASQGDGAVRQLPRDAEHGGPECRHEDLRWRACPQHARTSPWCRRRQTRRTPQAQRRRHRDPGALGDLRQPQRRGRVVEGVQDSENFARHARAARHTDPNTYLRRSIPTPTTTPNGCCKVADRDGQGRSDGRARRERSGLRIPPFPVPDQVSRWDATPAWQWLHLSVLYMGLSPPLSLRA